MTRKKTRSMTYDVRIRLYFDDKAPLDRTVAVEAADAQQAIALAKKSAAQAGEFPIELTVHGLDMRPLPDEPEAA